MTRADQKISERRALDAVLEALGLFPDQPPEAGEAPDFMVLLSGRAVGVEITMYRSGAAVEGGMGRRMVESEWDRLGRRRMHSAARILTSATSTLD